MTVLPMGMGTRGYPTRKQRAWARLEEILYPRVMGIHTRENLWVGHGYSIAPMGNPMDNQKKLINQNYSYDMWGKHLTPMAQP